jgi:DNA-binding response OmpR family regulator
MNKPVTIVMIEDDEGHARLIERNIRRAGVNNEIIHFSDGAAAYAYFNELQTQPADKTPILVLLDLNLPDVSGIDILEYLKNDGHLKVAPVIVLTTTDDNAEIQRCYDLGCNVYITKPVDYQQFATAIRQLGLFFSVIKVPGPLNA